jgi:leader peptidase (prepilin peptidase)/N-methyltransferase
MSVPALTLWAMQSLRAVTFGVGGVVFGSFLTVVVYRLPRGESVVTPRSACPQCGNTIRARDNVPVLSFVLLRGRCRHCGLKISPEYPLTEAFVGLVFLTVALRVPDLISAALLAPFLGVLVAAALIDLRHRIIPNRLVYPSLAVFGTAVALASLADGRLTLLRAVLGLVAYGGGLLTIAIVARGGMGMGDVKLAGLIGLMLGALGWRYLGVAAAVTILSSGVVAVGAVLAGMGRKHALPFGPFLAVGATVAALWGPQVAGWYGVFTH